MKRNPAWRGALFYFFLWAAIGINGPFLNVYLAQIGMTGFEIGILSAMYPLTVLTVGPWLSALADRKHWHLPFLIIGQGLGALMVFLLQYVQGFVPILVLTLLRSVAVTVIMPIADGLIARMARRHKVDYGNLRLWGSLSFALTTILGGALWQHTGFGAMFVATLVLSVPVMVAAPGLERTVSVSEQQAQLSWAILKQDTGMLALMVAMLFIGVAEGMYITFSGVYMDVLGGGQFLVGGLFGFSALFEILVMRSSGALYRKLGKPMTILLAFGIVGLSMFGYAIAQVPWVLVIFAVLKGVGFALYFVGGVSLVDERAPDAWAATLQSLMTAGLRGLAPLLTTPLGGWLSDSIGLQAVFAGAGVAAVVSVGILGAAMLTKSFEETPLLSVRQD